MNIVQTKRLLTGETFDPSTTVSDHSFLSVHDDEAPWYQFNAPLTMWFLFSFSFSSFFTLFVYSKTNWKVKIPKCSIIGPRWSKSFNRNVTWLVKMLNIYRRCRSILLWVFVKQIFHIIFHRYATSRKSLKSFLLEFERIFLIIINHKISFFLTSKFDSWRFDISGKSFRKQIILLNNPKNVSWIPSVPIWHYVKKRNQHDAM